MKGPLKNARSVYHIYRSRKLLLPMMGDLLKGRYRFSFFTLLVIVLSLVYVISPFDLLPDFIPVIGWIDDGVLLYLLLQQLKKETGRYALYRKQALQKGIVQ